MTHNIDDNNPGLMKGNRMGDYLINDITYLKEMDAFLYLLEHLPTGAQHLHISNRPIGCFEKFFQRNNRHTEQNQFCKEEE